MVFSSTPVFSTNKTDCHDITEILLKGAINTINHLPEQPSSFLLHNVFAMLSMLSEGPGWLNELGSGIT